MRNMVQCNVMLVYSQLDIPMYLPLVDQFSFRYYRFRMRSKIMEIHIVHIDHHKRNRNNDNNTNPDHCLI